MRIMLILTGVLLVAYCKYTFSISFNGLDIQGDVVLGALLPLNQRDCQAINLEGFLWSKALRYAVQNTKTYNIHNISLGLTIKDTCNSKGKTLDQALDFVHYTQHRFKQNQRKVTTVVLGSFQKETSMLLSLFKIPQMFFSESNVLPRSENSQYYFESVKVRHYRSKAIADIVRHFGWKSLALVSSRGRLDSDVKLFEPVAEQAGICLAVKVVAGLRDDEEESRGLEVVDKVMAVPGIQVVLLYTEVTDTLKILRAAAKSNAHARQVTWIDALGTSLTRRKDVASTGENILAMFPEFHFLEGFANYHASKPQLSPVEDRREKESAAFISQALHKMLKELQVENIYEQSDSDIIRTAVAIKQAEDLQGIFNSVNLVTMAMSKLIDKSCYDKTKSQCMESLTGQGMAGQLGSVMKGIARPELRNKELKHNLFSLVNIHGNFSRAWKARIVGTWEHAWYINKAGITWHSRLPEIPQSSCSPACPAGHIRDTQHTCKCCWSCQPCHYNQYVADNYTCADCLRGYWPSRDHRKCEFSLHVTITSCMVGLGSVAFVLSFLVL